MEEKKIILFFKIDTIFKSTHLWSYYEQYGLLKRFFQRLCRPVVRNSDFAKSK